MKPRRGERLPSPWRLRKLPRGRIAQRLERHAYTVEVTRSNRVPLTEGVVV